MANNTAKPKTTINLRKAAAGRAILENPQQSLKSALVNAGYAESTASVPKAKGLSVDVCVAEAIKANPDLDPSELLSKSRQCFKNKLDGLLDGAAGAEQLAKTRLGEVARMLEVSERWYGGHERSRTEVDQFTDRLEFMHAVLAEMKRRNTAPGNTDALSPCLDMDSTPQD